MIGRFEGEWLIRNPTSATSGTWPRCLNLAQPPPVVVLFVMFLIGCMQSRATSLAKKKLDQESLQCFTVIRFAFAHSVEQTSKGVWVEERKGGGGSKKKTEGIRTDFPFFMECNSMIRTFYAFLHLSPGSTLPVGYRSRSMLIVFVVYCRELSSTRSILGFAAARRSARIALV